MAIRLPPSIAALLELPPEERKLGSFVLSRQLGHGGFAPVWLAREVFGGAELRTAAVKLFSLHARGVDEERVSQASAAGRHKEHVIREAQALCKVEHPNVVRFYSMALDEERGVVGLAMEYVTGTPLDRKLEESGTLAPNEVIDVGIAVASALGAVHKVGLVHRDVKPSNVVEADGVYKLIDFGIASAEEGGERAPRKKRVVLDDLPFDVVGTKMSMLGAAYTVRDHDGATPSHASDDAAVLTGTIGYIDPEVVSAGAAADASSDLYGLGAMLYECLTGKVPAAATAKSGTGLAGDVLDGRATPRPVSELAPATPAPLAKLVDSLVSPRRDVRPASADAVAADLRAMRGAAPTLPVAVASTAPPSRARAWIAVGVLASVAAVAIVAVSRRDRATPTPALGSSTASAPVASAQPCSASAPNDCAVQCNAGRGDSCYTLALLYEDGRGVAKDVARAAALYAKACDAGNAGACYAAGRLLEARKELARAQARYEEGCTKGGAQSCNAAGRGYSEGLGVAPDPARAIDFYQRACDAAFPLACANLGVVYERGQGVPKDLERARTLYQRACDEGGAAAACGDLAHFFAEGLGVPKDEAHAAALYEKACEGGYPDGCGGLGMLLAAGRGVPKDAARAADLLKKACDADPGPACVALANLYARGDGVAKDPNRATSLYLLACDGGVPSACAGPHPVAPHATAGLPSAVPKPSPAAPPLRLNVDPGF